MTSLLDVAEKWPKEHLDDYIKNLEEQINNIRELVIKLKEIQRKKQKQIDRKLRESGARGAT